jgi:hypothetical protein
MRFNIMHDFYYFAAVLFIGHYVLFGFIWFCFVVLYIIGGILKPGLCAQ